MAVGADRSNEAGRADTNLKFSIFNWQLFAVHLKSEIFNLQ